MEFYWLWIRWSGVLQQILPRAPCLLLLWIPMDLSGKEGLHRWIFLLSLLDMVAPWLIMSLCQIGSCADGVVCESLFTFIDMFGCSPCLWSVQATAVDAHLRRLIKVSHSSHTLSRLLRWTVATTETWQLVLDMLQKLWSQWKVMCEQWVIYRLRYACIVLVYIS